MKDYTAPPTPQPAPHHRVTIRRVLLDWSHVDETPIVLDEVDRVIVLAFTVARLRPV